MKYDPPFTFHLSKAFRPVIMAESPSWSFTHLLTLTQAKPCLRPINDSHDCIKDHLWPQHRFYSRTITKYAWMVLNCPLQPVSNRNKLIKPIIQSSPNIVQKYFSCLFFGGQTCFLIFWSWWVFELTKFIKCFRNVLVGIYLLFLRLLHYIWAKKEGCFHCVAKKW